MPSRTIFFPWKLVRNSFYMLNMTFLNKPGFHHCRLYGHQLTFYFYHCSTFYPYLLNNLKRHSGWFVLPGNSFRNMMHTISDWGHRAEGISLVYLLCACICHMELNLYLSKDWVQSDNFGPTFVLGVFSSKGFQLSSSLLQLLLTHPFPYCDLLVATKWNLMLFLTRITLLQAEKLHRAVRWGPSWTSQNVLHLSSQEECSRPACRQAQLPEWDAGKKQSHITGEVGRFIPATQNMGQMLGRRGAEQQESCWSNGPK